MDAAVADQGADRGVHQDRRGHRQVRGGKIVISTIEDFILFVEAVEREYASATPREVAGEIRQLWFSDENWDVLLDSPGIRKGGRSEDIETEPNPIAKRFDMTLSDSGRVAVTLSNWAAQGDWRMMFLHRDRMKAVTPV